MIHRIQSRILFAGLAGAALFGALPSCGEADCLETKTCTKTQPSAGGFGNFGGSGLGLAPAPSKGGAATAGAAPTGSGGEAGNDSGEPCSDEGERRCAAAAGPTILECSDGVWVVAETCVRGELCDSTKADCATMAPGCERLAPGRAFCEDNDLVVCGPDLVTVERVACEGRCTSGACVDDASGGAPSGSGGSSNLNGGSRNESGGSIGTTGGAAPSDAGSGNEAGSAPADPCTPNPCQNGDICEVVGDGHECEPPSFEWIEPIQGWGSCGATDVSDDGQVVIGSCSDTPDGSARGFRWTRAEGMKSLGGLGDQDVPRAISGDGKVVVGNYWEGELTHWYRWSATAGVQAQDGLEGEVRAYAHDINYDGSVVVGGSIDSSGESRPFRWTAQSGAVDLGELHTYDSTEATTVSADGKVVAGYGSEGFQWTAQTGIVALPEPDDGGVYVRSMTSDGAMILGAGHYNGSYFGVLWRRGATAVEVLPDLGQQIWKISDDGVVAAGDYVWDGERFTGGAALDRAGVALPDDGLNFFVRAITPDGKTWVGLAHRDGNVAFIARLP